MPKTRIRNGELTIPLSEEIRQKLDVHDGDELEAHVFKGSVSFTPKSTEARERAWEDIFSIIDKMRLRPPHTSHRPKRKCTRRPTPPGPPAAPDSIMISAVYDTNILVSAFLSRHNPGGLSSELLRFARQGAVQLHLSPEIIAETLATLI